MYLNSAITRLTARPVAVAAAAVALALASARAQTPAILPYQRTLDLLICDSSFDGIWRMVDWNQDGDYLDPGEAAAYYDENVGTIALGTPTCIATSFDGTAYVGDANVDIVLALRDDNGDGDANDSGEHRIFFDNTNAEGLVMASIGGIMVDAFGRVFASVANSGSTGVDVIFLLEDLNGDGDANDLGESSNYHSVPNAAASTSHSIPTDVAAGRDLALYYNDIGVNGSIVKGVYRLADLNFDGDCEDAGERSPFWLPQSLNNEFFFGLATDQAGAWYLSDHGSNESVLRAFDANANGTIEPGEQSVFYTTGGSTWWDIVVRDDGALLLCEDQTTDRVTLLQDLNSDGDAMDLGEAIEIYDDTLAANPSVRPRGAAFLRAPLLIASPPTIAIGQTASFRVQTSKPLELAAVFLSVGTAGPVPLAPFGQVEIDASQVVALGFGVSDAMGSFAQPFAVPNSPAAIGTLAAQSWGGDAYRQFLSNSIVLTITP
ncbi:MAG: hypothetical protein AB8H80_14760 [Planctomycetota bacterium]